MNIRFPSSPPPAEVPVSAPGPHPALQVGAPNRYYAQLLSQDIAYTKGEMSAIYQYLYQQWRTHEQYPEFAGTLLRIAKVEMEHLEMLCLLYTSSAERLSFPPYWMVKAASAAISPSFSPALTEKAETSSSPASTVFFWQPANSPSVSPVSYTHLDVYKRQPHTRPGWRSAHSR